MFKTRIIQIYQHNSGVSDSRIELFFIGLWIHDKEGVGGLYFFNTIIMILWTLFCNATHKSTFLIFLSVIYININFLIFYLMIVSQMIVFTICNKYTIINTLPILYNQGPSHKVMCIGGSTRHLSLPPSNR